MPVWEKKIKVWSQTYMGHETVWLFKNKYWSIIQHAHLRKCAKLGQKHTLRKYKCYMISSDVYYLAELTSVCTLTFISFLVIFEQFHIVVFIEMVNSIWVLQKTLWPFLDMQSEQTNKQTKTGRNMILTWHYVILLTQIH